MLSVDNITLHYGAARALRGVSLEAKAGQVTCLLGRNGVGKTSMIRAITGRRAISDGAITLEDLSIHKMRPQERARRGLATVPQGREIFPLLSVKENLEVAFASLPRSERHVPEEAFEMFPILKEMLGRRGGDLSGGQQQQLAIARALTTRPKVLLLDEPTEGIQPSIIKDIGRAIDALRSAGSMAILLVEQYFEFARDLADQFYVMERGEIVASGGAEELRTPEGEARVRKLLAV